MLLEPELPWLLAPGLPSNGYSVVSLDTFHYNPQYTKCTKVVIVRHCLISVDIGQFARLLLPVGMVAIFKAPSPESNPNSPLTVNAMVSQCFTIES